MSIRRSIEVRLHKMASEWDMHVTSMEVGGRTWECLMEELTAAEETYVLHGGGFVMLEFNGRNVHVSKRSIPKSRVVSYGRPPD